MLRQQLNDALKAAMLGKDARSVSTIRLILAALKDRDIAARPKGLPDGIGEDEIRQMLQSMIKQRRESITLYQQGNRPELAQQEADEIVIIEKFLPRQMSDDEIAAAVKAAIVGAGATGLKDMGKVMTILKDGHAGQMDFTKASAAVKKELGG
ncbi:MAG: GatB/YqeY domain-containing protein [Magnetospirillum sp.]|nr:GatB/YqeY domain-containing protein [Magnetospirillum sp.]